MISTKNTRKSVSRKKQPTSRRNNTLSAAESQVLASQRAHKKSSLLKTVAQPQKKVRSTIVTDKTTKKGKAISKKSTPTSKSGLKKNAKQTHSHKKHASTTSHPSTHSHSTVTLPHHSRLPSDKKNTLKITHERDMALDFAGKVYREFSTLIKSVVLFGSTAKQELNDHSDIDIIIIIDDVSVQFDEELIAWYRTHLAALVEEHRYLRPLHVNSVKLSTWWQDLMRGDPVVLNVLRFGDALIDFGGFFQPLQLLLKDGKISSSPEAIYTLLERAPTHLRRARTAMLAVVDGLYWTMVDSAHAALIAADVLPPSPEKVPDYLNEYFVKHGMLHKRFISYYTQMHDTAKEIVHGKRSEIAGKYLDEWMVKADDFLREMARLIEDIIKKR